MHGKAFVERTGPLAFGHVTKSEAFLVDILDHQRFCEPRLLEILIRRFPVLAQQYALKGVPISAPPAPRTADEVKLIRGAHVNAPLVLDGKVYMGPGGGFMSSGASFHAVYNTQGWTRQIEWLEQTILKEGDSVRAQLASQLPGRRVSDFEFGLTYQDGRFFLFEKLTRTGIQLRC
jgi:hypothetical protein